MRPTFPSSGDTLSRATIVALGVAVVLLGVLVNQARVEARAHRRTVERALTEYAHFAAWELGAQARAEMQAVASSGFIRAFLESEGRGLGPGLHGFSSAVEEESRMCGCMALAGLYYRLDPRDSMLATAGPLSLDSRERAWLRQLLLDAATNASAETVPPRGTPVQVRVETRKSETLDTTRGAPGVQRRDPLVITRSSMRVASFALAELAGRRVMLVHDLAARDGARDPSLIGFAVDPAATLGPIFVRVIAQNRLLPPSVTRGLAPDSVLGARVTAPTGETLFTTGAQRAAHEATEQLGARYGGLAVTVGLRAALAGRLQLGGSASRIPWLVVMLGITLGLIAMLTVQLRRQAALARLRTDFVSGVSHELRTPLAQIRLLAELLAMGQPPTEEARRESARIIDQEARRLSHLVQNILSFSRTGRGTATVAPLPVDLADEVQQVIGTFRPLAAAEQVEIRAALQPGVVALVDPFALRQILINLLDNAVRYGGPERTVTVSVALRDDRACIAVADEGPGIPEREQALIWEPYYRLERDTAAVRGGSGIGLAVVRDLVQQHGGTVAVRNRERGGAEFQVRLPLAQFSDEPRNAPAAPAAAVEAARA